MEDCRKHPGPSISGHPPPHHAPSRAAPVKPGSAGAEYLGENSDPPAPDPPHIGWFRAMRTTDATELLRTNPFALLLAYVIGQRGQYRPGFNRFGLEFGEALLGDHENYGMSEQNYRTAKAQLEKGHFATFRPTNKGTVGKLTDTRLFSVFRLPTNDQGNGRVTDGQRLPRSEELKIVRARERPPYGKPSQ